MANSDEIMFSLEDDDASGLFITQTPSVSISHDVQNEENVSKGLLDMDSFDFNMTQGSSFTTSSGYF